MSVYAHGMFSYRLSDLGLGHEWVDMEWPHWGRQGAREILNELELGDDSPTWDLPGGITAYLHENEYFGLDRRGRVVCAVCDAWPCLCGNVRAA